MSGRRDEYEFEQRQLERKRKRAERKAKERKKKIALGAVAAIALLFSGRFIVSKMTNDSNAMGTRFVEASYESPSSQEESVEESVSSEAIEIDYMTEEEAERKDLKPRTEKVQVQGYQEKLDCYLRTEQDAVLYSRDSVQSNEIGVIPSGTYVESYGQEDGWTKVTSGSRKGYIENEDLGVISDPSLFKVVDGNLILNKTFSVPEEYVTVFDAQTEASMWVMLEAMERDGLSLEIGASYRTAEEEQEAIVLMGNPEGAPEPGHSAHQTGRAIQFYKEGTDPRMDNDFEKTEEFAWLDDHAHEYGFILRYPEGSEAVTGYRANPTIFLYIGVEDAKAIKAADVTLEEYYGLD